MKRKIFFFAIAISFTFLSCKEDFSPYGEFRQRYILTCVLRGDTTLQIATLSSSYFTGSPNPYEYTDDPSIRFADVRVWYEDSVYILHDSTVNRINTSRYKTPESFYVSNRFKISQNKPIEIEVLLQNGKRLKANSVTPKEILFNNLSDVLVPPVYGNLITIIWGNGNANTFYLPKMYIRYSKKIGNQTTNHELEVPVRYTFEAGVEQPVYPSASNLLRVVYDRDVISKTLTYLKELEDENSIISVYEKLSMKVAILDDNLTRYVSSTSQTFDDLTVRVNESDYSNIDGGLGIFGSFIIKDYERLRFQESYISSFGLSFIKEL